MILTIFESTHDALAAERILLQNKHQIDIIPTPRKFSASCGLSIICRDCQASNLQALLASNSINNTRFFKVEEESGEKFYKELKDGQA